MTTGWRRKKLWLEVEEFMVGGGRSCGWRPKMTTGWRRKKASLEVDEGVVGGGRREKIVKNILEREKITETNGGGEIRARILFKTRVILEYIFKK
uniref:Uncharacterized protein n=1 Tax=Cucumis melo TaxID=3656 RepID=A0A9I9E9K6_CUCME